MNGCSTESVFFITFFLFVNKTDKSTIMIETKLTINKKISELLITEKSFTFKQTDKETVINSEDILGFDNEFASETRCVNLYYIYNEGQKLEKKALEIEGAIESLQNVVSMVKENISNVPSRPKSIIVFLNPMGGSANSENVFRRDVEPLIKLASIKYELIVSESPNNPKEFANSFDFAPYDLLTIMGGDGTFNIIMNNLFLRRQSEGHIDVNDLHATLVPIDIPVAFIPGGTGNGMAQIAYQGYDVISAVLHIIRGKTKSTSIFGNYCESKLVAYSFMMTATGMFVDLIKATERHRWMRKLRYVFVPTYFFLIRSHRQIDVELEFEDVLESDGTVESTKNKENMQETVLSTFLINGKSFFAPEHETTEEHISVILNKPTSKWQLIKNFFSLLRKPTYEEYEMNSSVILKFVKSMKMIVKNPDPESDYSLNLDGEVYDMCKPEVQVRLIQSAYKLVTAQMTATKEG